MRKWGLLLLLAVATVTAIAAAGAGAAGRARVSTYDSYWLKSSAQGDMFEINGGKIAQSKGTDQSVKNLGTMLVKDHSKSLSDAKKLARKLGVRTESSPEPSQQWELEILQTQSGNSFDQWYAKLEVKDHIQDIQDTQEEIHSGANPAVRAEARKDLPMLRKHLAAAQAALKKVS